MDEKNNSDVIMNSLPLSRKDIVIARYISCAIFIAGSMLVTMFVIFLIRSVGVVGVPVSESRVEMYGRRVLI